MKKYVMLIILLISATTTMLFGAKIAIIGFKDKNPKTEFITRAFVKLLNTNLEEAGFEIQEDKSVGLDYALLKQSNFYLASKEFFDDYENLELDNSMYGTFSYRGKSIYLNIEVYSREKRRLVLKGEIKGNKRALQVFFNQATTNILNSMGSDHQVKDISSIDDDNYYYKYIKFSYEAEKLFESDAPDKYYSLMDELEAIQDKFEEYPEFKKLYDELKGQSEDFLNAGLFDKPFSFISIAENPDDNEIEKFARELIVNGYVISFADIIQIPVEDEPELINMAINYEIRLKKSYLKKMKNEIKRRRGNPHFTDMGRYFFSNNDNDSEKFRDFILRQMVILRLFDINNELIVEGEIEINNSNYGNGSYRHLKQLPLPLTPRGPANAAFGVDNFSKIKFIFEDLKRSDLERIERSEIEIIFD